MNAEASGHDVECLVIEHANSGKTYEKIAQNGLFFTMKLELLHSEKLNRISIWNLI